MTIATGSKKDVINQNYANALTVQFAPLTTTEINARAPNDKNGTVYHNITVNKLQVKLGGSIKTITSS